MGRKVEPFENILAKLIDKAEGKSVPQIDPGVRDPIGQSVATNYSTRSTRDDRADEDFKEVPE